MEIIPYYPMVKKAVTLSATTDITILTKAKRVVLALPTQQLRPFLEEYSSLFLNIPILLLQKGIEKESGLLPTAIVSQYLNTTISLLSGPNFADEILMGLPAAAAIACTTQEEAAVEWAKLLKSSTFRPYVQSDVIGMQVGGAVKNVIAIACGVVKGLKLGDNTLAAIITRGLAEMVRLGIVMGAKKETFLGLSGIGDLTLTCHGEKSRNLRFGVSLAKQESWDESTQGTVEGYHTVFSIETLMNKYKIEMPISEYVLKLIRKQIAPVDVISALMDRKLKQEVF
jgi:glycerol-3-phosphate dehydrogenase (NAD(P)+)